MNCSNDAKDWGDETNDDRRSTWQA